MAKDTRGFKPRGRTAGLWSSWLPRGDGTDKRLAVTNSKAEAETAGKRLALGCAVVAVRGAQTPTGDEKP